jgi:hypothetical protein
MADSPFATSEPIHPPVDTLPYWLSFLYLCHSIAASQVHDNNVLVVCRVEASRGCELAISLGDGQGISNLRPIYLRNTPDAQAVVGSGHFVCVCAMWRGLRPV